jgi:predicted outer membrane repeat protein/parallel beta-helix repeat protein
MKKLIAGTMLVLAMCVLAVTAPALTITVTNTNDSGPGSLRDALAVANDGDTIAATGVSGTILLTSGELYVNQSITISGPGASILAVNGNAQSSVFVIRSLEPVTISGLTITNGNLSSAYLGGGGIYNNSTLTLNNCTVSNNWANVNGGGIYNDGSYYGSAPVTLNNCTVSGNTAYSNDGGGIYNNDTVTLNNCTVSNNSAYVSGGGIYNDASYYGSVTVTLNNCTVSGNTAANNDGGGICNYVLGYSDTAIGTVVISNSTFSNNTAISNGGAISSTSQTYIAYYTGATLNVSNSTFSGNSAPSGGIYNDGSYYGSATVTLRNTILKAGASGQNIQNVSGTIMSQGYNLSSDNGGGYLTHPGDRINTNPRLGPLQDNGGPTLTQALLPGSPAVNAGDPNFTPPPFYDQRGPGFDRVKNGRIDIGSFEVQAATPRVGPTPRVRPTPQPR